MACCTKGKAACQHICMVSRAHQSPGDYRGLSRSHGGADAFVGCFRPNIVSQGDGALHAEDAIVFAMANPVPEIMPEDAQAAGARIIGTGRSDYPTKSITCWPFRDFFRGALRCPGKRITQG